MRRRHRTIVDATLPAALTDAGDRMYELELLGGLVLEGPKGPLSGYAAQSRQLALLALLGAAGDAGLSRYKLCAYLWPESGEASAHHSLTDAVYRLRKSMGREAVLGRSVTLRLNPDVIRCDVTAFEAALEDEDLETAAELYRGSFLDGFHLRESSEFEHWKDEEARRLGSMFEGLLETLAAAAESAGDHAAAVKSWWRLAEHDPFNSRTVVRLMEAQAAAGDPANAVLYAREHTELLRRELDVEPPEELVDLAERLRSAHPASDQSGDRLRVPKIPRLPLAPPRGGKATAPSGARRWMVAGLPVAVVGIVAAMWMGTRGAPEPAGPEAGGPDDGVVAVGEAEEPERLVVMPLDNLSGESEMDVWGQLAAEEVGIAIDRAGPIIVLPARRVREAIRTLGAGASASSVATRLRASHAMEGTIARTGRQIRFRVELLDLLTEERLVDLDPVVGAMDSVEAVVGRLAQAAATAAVANLEAGATAFGEAAVAHESLPPRVDVYLDYVLAVDLSCQWQLDEAIKAATRAVAADPDYMRAQHGLGMLYSFKQRYREADSIFSELTPLRDRMTRVERAGLDYWVAYIHGNADGTHRAIEEVYRIAPTAQGYVAGLEMAQRRRYMDALPRYLAQDLDGVCAQSWPWYWTAPAGAYHVLGRFEEELDLVRRGFERLPGHVGLMRVEARVFAATDRLEAVDSVLDAIAVLPSKPGFDTNVQIALVGLELNAHGHPEAAERAFARALEGFAAQPPDENRYNRGRAFYYTGRWASADTLFAALVEMNPDAMNNPAVWHRGHRGVTLARLGRRAEAMEIDRWLAAIPERPGLRGLDRAWRARIAAVLGDQDAAVRHFRDALDHRGEAWVHADPAFEGMWGYPRWEALMAPR